MYACPKRGIPPRLLSLRFLPSPPPPGFYKAVLIVKTSEIT